MNTEIRNRLLVGFPLALLFIGAIAVDLFYSVPYAILALLCLGVIAAGLEFAQLLRQRAPGVQRLSMVCIACLLILLPAFSLRFFSTWLPPGFPIQGVILGLGFIWVALRQFQRYGTQDFSLNVGTTTLGICYTGLLPSMLVSLLVDVAVPQRGHILLLLVVATVKMGDIAAFVGGKCFGRNKMAPSISPGKTWEGFAASFLGALIGAYGFIALSRACGAAHPFSGHWQAAVWALVLGPIGVLGDLWESALKRDLAVKDSSSWIPGFGGILDLFDAVILAAPIALLLSFILA